MDKTLEIYSYILKEYLSKYFANQLNVNPVELNIERFRTRAVFIASIIFLKNNYKIKDCKIVSATNYWLKSAFADENLFSSIISSTSEILIGLIDEKLCDLTELDNIDISTLYETLLSVETGNENKGTKISTAKNYRNKLGSYYTPQNLAKSVTKKTIDVFLELNFANKKISTGHSENLSKELLNELSSISFVDFSCGGGIFLIEVINYFEIFLTRFKVNDLFKTELLRSIAMNISAIDVDCIALEVAKLNLLLRIKQPTLYERFGDNFIHANFLLQSDFAIEEPKKIETFSKGFIYHEKLSLHKQNLKKYDVILGNPPWEKIRFEEKKFYALYSNVIADNHFKSSRVNEINEIELNNIQLAEFSKEFKLEIEKAKLFLKKNPFFNLSNNGELNTYALFTDASLKLKTKRGVIGLVLKSAVVTSQVNQNLFKHITKEKLVVAIYDFINRKKIFNIDSRERFCFLLLGNSINENFYVSMNLNEVEEIETSKSGIELSYNSLISLNPFTGMLPNFSTKEEADFLLRVSNDFPFFKNIFDKVRFGRIVHFTSHAEFISKKKLEDNIPIYEGKFFHQFDGKFSGFNGVADELRYGNKSSSVVLDESKKNLIDYIPESRFFINREKWLDLSKNHTEKFMLAWRSLTSATNTRTCIATVLPFIPASQSVQFLTTNPNDLLYLTGLFNSVVFDFILKKKLSGIDLTQSVLNQIPIPNIEQIESKIKFNGCIATIKQHISLLVLSLLRNDSRLNFSYHDSELNYKEESRFKIIRNIDLLFMFLYKLNSLELKLLLTSFSKQYSKSDLNWFDKNLKEMLLDETISSSSSFIPHLAPSDRVFN